MYGIAEVVLGVNDWILGIIVIPRLPSRTGHPDYTLESIFTDNVNYRLEIITKCHRTVLDAFAVIYVNRFVGKLDAHLACIIIKECSERGDCTPYGLEIFLICITHLNVVRTYARRTDNNI